MVTDDRQAALDHAAGCERVLVEEFLDGPEVSLFALCGWNEADGSTVYPLQPAQDFKRIFDGDAGPNTGGMGAYTPLPWAPDGLVEEVLATVLQPTVDEMAARGTPFSGLLYAGLALTAKGVRVVEFNARFGDPETQALLALLDSPLGALLAAARRRQPGSRRAAALEAGCRGRGGAGVAGLPGVLVHGRRDRRHRDPRRRARRRRDPRRHRTGRRGPGHRRRTGPRRDRGRHGLADARAKAYEGVASISFPGAQWRTDIARGI